MKRLEQLLRDVDGKGYPAYKSLKGRYRFDQFDLQIDHVQGDPFASPSKLSVHVKGSCGLFPTWAYKEKLQRITLQDFLLRGFYAQVSKYTYKAKGSGKSGAMIVSNPGPEVLERTACEVKESSGDIVVRFEVGFPANGRRIQAKELGKILFDYLPICVNESLRFENVNQRKLQEAIYLREDQEEIRQQLREKGLVGFVADGSMLPRQSGVSSQPMRSGVPFKAPEELAVELNVSHQGRLRGMGIQKGVTLIVGGGYHGKSTLLQALEMGVYSHISGDGREFVVTEDTAMKIRAEDGRNISGVDISNFIHNLPNRKDTTFFQTMDASGSTSQAANVAESIAGNAKVLLIDEDTSATNFMVRDELMQRVINGEKEPIIPFIERVEELYEKFGISTILVAGSSGAYFHVADTIIQMDNYEPKEITLYAKKEAEAFQRIRKEAKPIEEIQQSRVPVVNTTQKNRDGRVKIKGMSLEGVMLNNEYIDLRYVEQLVDPEQVKTLGYFLNYMEENIFDGDKELNQCVEEVFAKIEKQGIGTIIPGNLIPGNLAYPRKEEVYACINRYRRLEINGAK